MNSSDTPTSVEKRAVRRLVGTTEGEGGYGYCST